MSKQYDFKKEWENTRQNLVKFSKQAQEIARKDEVELKKFSHKSGIHIDATAAGLKKEHLYYLIGKEYTKLKILEKPSAKMVKLMDEFKKICKEQKALKAKLKK